MNSDQEIDPMQAQKLPALQDQKIITDVDISLIEFSSSTQLRCRLNTETVATYADEMKNGTEFPPVILFSPDAATEKRYFIGDGHHRIEAAKTNGETQIKSEIRSGGYEDALIFAAGANDKHGLRVTRKDKQNAITILLKNPVFQNRSDREISEIVHTDHKTVGSVRKKLVATGEIPQITEREVSRNGQNYKLNTENISSDGNLTIEVSSSKSMLPYNLIFADIVTLQKSKKIFNDISNKMVDGGFLLVASEQSEVPGIIKAVDTSLKFFWIFSLPNPRSVEIEHSKITSQWKPVLVWSKGNPAQREFSDFTGSNGDKFQFDPNKFYQMLLTDFTKEDNRLGVIVPDDHQIYTFGKKFKCHVEPVKTKS